MGLATTGIGTYMQMDATGRATQAKVAADQQNAALNDARATLALHNGSIEAARYRTRAGEIAGQQRAGYAASGVDANVGTPADMQASTRASGELDALMAKNNAARQAWGFRVNGFQDRLQAAADVSAGADQSEAEFLSGVGKGEDQVAQAVSGGGFLGG